MTSRTQINVDIVGQYKGSQNIKKAQSEFTALGTTVTKLAKAFGVTFAASELVKFSKAAVTAFAADDKSAKILANTLSNLGQSFADVPIEKFITNLSEVNGIAKTDLRTAFDTLVRSTGDATKSQKLLNLGLDISAGTGKDLASVTMALGKAYGGNNSALARLGAGLTKVQLKTLTFAQLTDVLSAKFKGDASTAADSYAGTIARLKQSFEEFKITIGSGIVDALTSIGNGNSIKPIQDGMQNLATYTANVISGLGILIGDVASLQSTKPNPSIAQSLWNDLVVVPSKALYAVNGFISKYNVGVIQTLQKIGAQQKATVAQMNQKNSYHDSISGTNAAIAGAKKLASAQATANAANLAAANKLAAAAKATLQAQRDALGLKLAGNTTDMQNIEIQAALQRGQTQQVNDVLLLQRAILDGNGAQAEILAQKVLVANGLVMDVSGNISSLAGAKNPFADWPPETDSALAQVAAIQLALANLVAKPYVVIIQQDVVGGGGGGAPPAPKKVTNPPKITVDPFALQDPLAPVQIGGTVPSTGTGLDTGSALSTVLGLNYNQPTTYTMSSVNPLSSVMPSQIGGSASSSSAVGTNYNQPITVVLTVDSAVLAQATVNPSASGVPNSFSRSLIF
jgi:hypothetical protein